MFGDRLREIRKEKALTLEDLAELYNERFNEEGKGLNKGTLSKYENNKQRPFIETVYGLCEILEVSVDFLMGKSDNPYQSVELGEDEMIINIQNKRYIIKKEILEQYGKRID